jgi:hypothetical protein
MGHLLYLIVERSRPATRRMISALVTYLGANDAGTGFYVLAQELQRLNGQHLCLFTAAGIRG